MPENYLITGYKALIVDKGKTEQLFAKTKASIEQQVDVVLAHTTTSPEATATIFEQREVLLTTCQKQSS